MPPKHCLCFKAYCHDGSTRCYINITGDASVGLPLTRNMEPIPSPSYMDHHGLNNLVIPIAVGDVRSIVHESSSPPTVNDATKKALVVDVVIHEEITKRLRCVPKHHLHEEMIKAVILLSSQWVTQEAGLHLNLSSAKILADCPYKHPSSSSKSAKDSNNATIDISNVTQRAEALYQEMISSLTAKDSSNEETPRSVSSLDDSAPKLPTKFLVDKGIDGSKNQTKNRTPLVQEVVADGSKKGIKKGFLNQPNASLYGVGGTGEGTLPPDAGDPLGHIPKSLRSKCKIVDARNVTDFTSESATEFLWNKNPPFAPRNNQPLPGTTPPVSKKEDQHINTTPIRETPPSTDGSASSVTKQQHNNTTSTVSTSHINAVPVQTTHQLPNGIMIDEVPSVIEKWAHSVDDTSSDTLLIRIVLPMNIKCAADIHGDIDVAADGMSLCIGTHYIIPLPYKVFSDSVTAKFVKKTHQLVLTLQKQT